MSERTVLYAPPPAIDKQPKLRAAYERGVAGKRGRLRWTSEERQAYRAGHEPPTAPASWKLELLLTTVDLIADARLHKAPSKGEGEEATFTLDDMRGYVAPVAARVVVFLVRRRAERSRAVKLELTGRTAPLPRTDATGLIGQFATGLLARHEGGPDATVWPVRLGGAIVADARRRRSWRKAMRAG